MRIPIVFQLITLCVTAILFSNASSAGEPFQVLTYNIRYQNRSDGPDVWENRKAAVIETLRQADLIGLQEVVASQFDDVQTGTEGWMWYGIGRNDALRGGEMTAVGWKSSRFAAVEHGTIWLSETPTRIGKSGWDAALPRIASWVRLVDRRSTSDTDPGTILFVNTHFDHQGPQARRNSGLLLREWIAKVRFGAEVILVGDLNAKLDSPPLLALMDKTTSENPPLVDAKTMSKLADNGPDSTWNGFKEIQPGQRIDHVLMQSETLQVLNYQTLDPKTEAGRFASDHLPILVEFAQ